MEDLFDVFDVQMRDGRLTSVLCLHTTEGPVVDLTLLRYLGNLRANGASQQHGRGCCYTLGLLYTYFRVVWQTDANTRDDIQLLVGEYLLARRRGIDLTTSNGRLSWQPVKIATVLRDRAFIRKYAQDCLEQENGTSLFDSFAKTCPGPASHGKALQAVARIAFHSRATSVLAHLSAKIKPREPKPFGYRERAASSRQHSKNQYLPLDVARRLIDTTASPVQKMIFIQAFFGGPRLSEMLNQWRCDVRPGEDRPILFPGDRPSATPLVILAHPSQALYTGSLHDTKLDRAQYLKAVYGLLPRSELDGYANGAGWKGMTFDNDAYSISQLFWTSEEYAQLFYSLFLRLQYEIYPQISKPVLNSHPYLFVNECPSKREFGAPMKASNIRKAYARAVDRLGLDARKFGMGIHSARHAYKSTLENDLHLSREDMQICMHHASLMSQNVYGKSLEVLRTKLNNAMGERHA